MPKWSVMTHLCDSNVFIALVLGQHIHHARARQWFETLGENERVAFCRATQISFLRLLTQPIAPGYQPLTNRAAWDILDALMQDDNLTWVPEPPNLDPVWRKLADLGSCSPKHWMDAYLAAFAVAGGFQLVTFDSAFRQFERLDTLILAG